MIRSALLNVVLRVRSTMTSSSWFTTTSRHASSSVTTEVSTVPSYICLYDGNCPLCMIEIDWLRARCEKRAAADPSVERVAFVDLLNPSAIDNTLLGKLVGKKFDLRSRRDYDVLMDSFHGLRIVPPSPFNRPSTAPVDIDSLDVKVESGTDVFFSIYRAAGLAWAVSPLGWKLTRPITKWLYSIWAKYRLWLGGRNKEDEWAKSFQCDENSCKHIKNS